MERFTMNRPAPADKARELAVSLGTPRGALTVAEAYRGQHEEGSPSWCYWHGVCAYLEKDMAHGLPHTRHARRQLRGDAR
jgi:hypothetical protein